MRFRIKFVCFLFTLSSIIGCWKEYSHEGGSSYPAGGNSSGNTLPIKSEWEFKENGVLFHGPVDTAWLSSQDNGQIIIATGKTVAGNGNLYLYIKSLSGPIQKNKTYSTTQQEIKFSYSVGSNTIYSAAPYKGGEIYLTVTDIGPDRIVGTFKGLAENNNGKSVEIAVGKFSSPLKMLPPSGAKGSVILWAKESCNGPVKVKINNQPGEITVFSGIPPECGDSGRATYNLAPGIYNWTAYCGRDSVNSKVEVRGGSCTRILVTFPFKLSPFTETNNRTCKLSDLSYSGCLLTRCSILDLYKPLSNANNITYIGSVANNMTYTIFRIGYPLTFSHPVRLDNNKIIIDEGSEEESYFITDAQGRVIKYHGLKDPATTYPLDSIIITYEYDNDNNLIKRTIIDARYLAPVREMDFIWQNGNVTKIIDNNLASGEKNETDFEYYTTKDVRSLPFTFTDAFELLLFQPVINFGNHMKNPIKREIIHAFDINRKPVLVNFDFLNYILDDNNYVLRFTARDEYGTSSDFSFKYKCF